MLRSIKTTVVGLAASLLCGQLLSQDALAILQVKGGLYSIMGSGGNIGVRVTPDGIILIDDKFPQNFEEIRSLVASVSDLPVKYVINTHHHGDHSGSNPSFAPIAELIAHRNARANMVRANMEGLPEIVFSSETSVFLGGVEVRASHLGTGHTDGDAVIYFPDLKTVHGGDLLNGNVPFIDYANGGNSRGWVATINNILALDFDTAIPGHGSIMSRADVVTYRNQMENVRERMKELVIAGVPAGEAAVRIKSEDLPWTMQDNGMFMQRSISGLYEEIAAELNR